LRPLFVGWLILATLVASDAVIVLLVHLLCRLVDLAPARAPLAGHRFVLSRIAHGYFSDRIGVLISIVAWSRSFRCRGLILVEGISGPKNGNAATTERPSARGEGITPGLKLLRPALPD
jgi:hypothetical protein